jgi:nucleoid DNA-binding protein
MPQKQAHHLRTGQAIIIAARPTPTFRTGKRLEDRKGAPEAKTAFIDTA